MKVVGCQPYAPAAFIPRIILVLIFRGWVDPRAHRTVRRQGKNPRWHRELIPGPSDLKHSALTTTLPQAPFCTGTYLKIEECEESCFILK
jgi:hypothetical protein